MATKSVTSNWFQNEIHDSNNIDSEDKFVISSGVVKYNQRHHVKYHSNLNSATKIALSKKVRTQKEEKRNDLTVTSTLSSVA